MRTINRISRIGLLSAVVLASVGLAWPIATAGTVNAIYNAATDVPVTAGGYTATGNTVNFTLNFAPVTGTDLMVVQNTGLAFINGTFANLAQGQAVALSYGGVIYRFVANYFGGSGNELVLSWANNCSFAWGHNSYGQLGNDTTTNWLVPAPVMAAGVLTGKTVVALSAGFDHSLALCSDGTVVAWGNNNYAQLGDNTVTKRLVPVAVNTAAGVSALYGKKVVAIAAGSGYSLALCSDGTVAGWGWGGFGNLGDNSTTNRFAPVAVNTTAGLSALYGKTVVAISAGYQHNLALCSDGTVAAWGYNPCGQVGDNTSQTNRIVPVAVNAAPGVSALYGKTVVSVSAGQLHSLALCSDGSVAAWGGNGGGALGNNSTIQHNAPVAVSRASGISALYGKTVVSIAAGAGHSLALCSDGSVASWGDNFDGALGDNTTSRRLVPVAVNAAPAGSALYGKTVLTIAAGYGHSLAMCSDGTVAAWGYNSYGELGDNTTSNRLVPVAVSTTPLAANQRLARVVSGPYAAHILALVAWSPALPITVTDAHPMSSGAFRFAFTNMPGGSFGVLAATNPTLPLSNWTLLTGLTEVLPGQFQFIDPQATNSPRRFYRVRSP